ncbi:helix-turn-helix transcriptional regulator [Streptomyces sp. NPDC050516]|uniref:helix-turn-helix transcriptional regulator n=1 Tax=Streptomyces sp. NPDC050516 TaxID=3365621 RepID=UPI00379896C3
MRRELGDFLRSRRERITPADVGLPAGTRRRTPGLRREEVAQLAFISTEYYTRLEQARAPHPSREVLTQLARALRLSDAERDHLHHLADAPPGPLPGPSREVRQSILDLLQRLPEAAAIVTSATYEVIAWNHLAAALMEDFSALSRRDRNLIRRAFLSPHQHGRRLYGISDADEFARTSAHHLRTVAARYPNDLEVAGLVEELRSHSPEFARLWTSHDVKDSEAIAHRGWGRYHPKLNVPNLVATIDVVPSLTGQNLGQTPEEMLANTSARQPIRQGARRTETGVFAAPGAILCARTPRILFLI